MSCRKVCVPFIGLYTLVLFIGINEAANDEAEINKVETESAIRNKLQTAIRNAPSPLVGKIAQDLPSAILGNLVHNISPKAATDVIGQVTKSDLKTALQTETSAELYELLDHIRYGLIPTILADLPYSDIGEIYAGEPKNVQVKLAKALTNKDAGDIVKNLPTSNLEETAKALPKADVDAILRGFAAGLGSNSGSPNVGGGINANIGGGDVGVNEPTVDVIGTDIQSILGGEGGEIDANTEGGGGGDAGVNAG